MTRGVVWIAAMTGIGPIVSLSLAVALGAVGLGALLGIPLGLRLGRLEGGLARLLEALARCGLALPPVVVGLLLYLLLSRQGPLGGLQLLYSPTAMLLAQTLLVLPFIVALVAETIRERPPGLIDEIRAMGADEAFLRRALLREARPGIVLALLAAFGRSFSEVGAVLIVGGNIEGETRVLTTAIVLDTARGNFDRALVLALVLMILALVVNLGAARILGRRTRS